MRQVPSKKILLGVTGSIAAYKIPDLIRELRAQNHEVKVVITAAAKSFVTVLTLQELSGNRVHEAFLDPSAELHMGHTNLARWADVILIAPASANFIAKLAHGFADDLLSTLCLAADCPIIIVPAMNQAMWKNVATQANLEIIKQRNIQVLGPAIGEQACGEVGPGRMLEPEEIIVELARHSGMDAGIQRTWTLSSVCSKGIAPRVLITAGPTQEAIDPVRFISNHSSGKMGYCLAAAFAARGAKVILISGPTHLSRPNNLEKFISVTSAQEMLEQVLAHMTEVDVMISAAAIADYRPIQTSIHKIKKSDQHLELKLEKTKDILQEVRAQYPEVFLVGFALETESLLENAKQKLADKKLDMIIANQITETNPIFGADENRVTVLQKSGANKEYKQYSKSELATQLVDLICKI